MGPSAALNVCGCVIKHCSLSFDLNFGNVEFELGSAEVPCDSCSLCICRAVKLARKLGPGHTIVTVLCDGGDRYRSKMYNKKWLEEKELVPQSDGDSLGFVV